MKTGKQVLRQRVKENIIQLSPEAKSKQSNLIRLKIRELSGFKQSKTILVYLSTSEEVDTLGLIRDCLGNGRKIVVPKVSATSDILTLREIQSLGDDQLEVGSFGILEPIDEKTNVVQLGAIDCVVVPGLAFDANGNRLGRGKGYYDRLLNELSPSVCRIGLAFDCQYVDIVPTEKHDAPVQIVLTA
ncbi:MAG: 5-formyltetrahydrofolate cyclo-ligase [Candidatus Omnitrophota bacterium]|jgi:5-formyltetrahydrofolate cyclo-ligase